ncbi:MAG: phage holin family protein [Myxococcaceae bacterium]
MPTADLVRHAVDEARLLVKAEVLNAKLEIKEELQLAKKTGIFIGAAAVLALCGLSSLFVALGIALPGAPGWGVLIVGVLQLAAAGGLGYMAMKKLPKKPMNRTIDRLKTDIAVTREQFA